MRVAGPFGCQCQSIRPCLRFHSPLFEPDMRISRIRLSDQNIMPYAHRGMRQIERRRFISPYFS